MMQADRRCTSVYVHRQDPAPAASESAKRRCGVSAAVMPYIFVSLIMTSLVLLRQGRMEEQWRAARVAEDARRASGGPGLLSKLRKNMKGGA